MMKHKEIERLIQRKLDRELSSDEKRKLDKHLAQCSHCRQLDQEMVRATRWVSDMTEFYPQAGFNMRVLAKLGLKRRFSWTKAAIAFVGSWIAALLLFAYSPLPTQAMNRIATSVPALMRLYNNVQLVVSSFSQVLSPLFKSSISNFNPIIGLVFSIMFVYFLGRALQKEVRCNA
jgi:predicted anti-sigma-YlaC factor YlaD